MLGGISIGHFSGTDTGVTVLYCGPGGALGSVDADGRTGAVYRERVPLANPFAGEAERGMVEHMNSDHAAAIAHYVELAGLPASQWFANREQYRRDYRQQFAVWSLELVPGQFIESESFPLRGDRATGLLVFAGYNTPGAHRLRLDQQQRVWLRLDTREMRLVNDPATR